MPSPVRLSAHQLPLLLIMAPVAGWLLSPVVGVAAALLSWTLLQPWGRSIGERVVVGQLLLLALVGLVFVVVPLPVSRLSASIFVLGLPLLAAATRILATRGVGRRPWLPSFGPLDVSLVAVGAGEAFWVLQRELGVSLRATLERVFYGWDYVSHFSMFADAYRYGRLNGLMFGSAPEYLTPPPTLHPVLWATFTWAGQTGSQRLPGAQLLQANVLLTGLTAAMCVLVLAWVSADLVRAIAGPDAARWGLPTAAMVTGVVSALNTPTALFFAGHTPFLLAVTTTVLGSHLVFREGWQSDPPDHSWGVLFLAAAALTCMLEWPPVVLGLVPAAGYELLRLRHASRRLRVLFTVIVVAAAVPVVSMARSLLHSASLQTLVHQTGGLAAFNGRLAWVVGPLVLLVGLAAAWDRRWFLAAAVTAPLAGLMSFVVFLKWNGATWTTGQPSYYLLKTVQGCLVVAIPVLVAATVGGIVQLSSSPSGTADNRRLAIWLSVTAVVVATLAVDVMEGPRRTVLSGIPVDLKSNPAYLAAAAKIDTAYRITTSSFAELPFFWDGEDRGVRTNRWLLSLKRGFNTREDHFYAALSTAPPGMDAALICQQLRIEPTVELLALTASPALAAISLSELPATDCDISRVKIVPLP